MYTSIKLLARVCAIAAVGSFIASSSSCITTESDTTSVNTDGSDDELAEAQDAVCSPCGGTYGALQTTYRGTQFYSNGDCTATLCGNYQCPEVVKRYTSKVGVSEWVGDGQTYCSADTARTRNLFFFSNASGSPGYDGDIVGFNGINCGSGAGHVGVRCGTPDTASWQLCDQNRTSIATNNPKTLSRTGGQLNSFSASCSLCGYSRPGWDFSSTYKLGSGAYGWTLTNMALVSSDSIGLRLNPGDSDPQLLSPSNLDVYSRYTLLGIRIRSHATNHALRVYFTTDNDSTWNETKAQSATIPSGTNWSTVYVDFSTNTSWTNGGRIDQIRLDPAANGDAGSSTDYVDIDWVQFGLPLVTSVSPSSATKNVSKTFTIAGTGLPSTTVAFVSNCQGSTTTTGTSSQRTFSCTPAASGTQQGIVKDMSGGNVLYTFTVTVP